MSIHMFSIGKRLPYGVATIALAIFSTGVWADEIVKIGSVEPVTGSIAHLGKDNENGAQLAIEDINKKGLTINGVVAKIDSSGGRTPAILNS